MWRQERRPSKQKQGIFTSVMLPEGSAHKTVLPISINAIRARQIRTVGVCPPTGDSNSWHFSIDTNQPNNYSYSQWQLALVFLSVIFLEGGFPEMLIISSIKEYLECLQVGLGLSKSTTHMVLVG